MLHRRRRKKLLLVLEDVHWVDEGSKDLLQDLLGWRANETEERGLADDHVTSRKRWFEGQIQGALFFGFGPMFQFRKSKTDC